MHSPSLVCMRSPTWNGLKNIMLRPLKKLIASCWDARPNASVRTPREPHTLEMGIPTASRQKRKAIAHTVRLAIWRVRPKRELMRRVSLLPRLVSFAAIIASKSVFMTDNINVVTESVHETSTTLSLSMKHPRLLPAMMSGLGVGGGGCRTVCVCVSKEGVRMDGRMDASEGWRGGAHGMDGLTRNPKPEALRESRSLCDAPQDGDAEAEAHGVLYRVEEALLVRRVPRTLR